MKRKTAFLLCILFLLLTLVPGCVSNTSVSPASPAYIKGGTPAPPSAAAVKETAVASVTVYELVDSFNAFKSCFTNSYNLINPLTSTAGDVHLADANKVVQCMYASVEVMLPILVCPGNSGELESELGIKDVSVTFDGQEYIINYTTLNLLYNVKQTVKYDPATDSLSSTACNYSLGITVQLEYVNTPGGYAVQSCTQYPDGTITVCKGFFDSSDFLEFGVEFPVGLPASIFKDASQSSEIIKGCDVYCILSGDSLTVYEKTGASSILNSTGA